ncbi:MAG: hypothetical protein M1338_00375 [Patescibacteria group bacterium]|nr:hypothetical protein [Patescibacteria group bacterium]
MCEEKGTPTFNLVVTEVNKSHKALQSLGAWTMKAIANALVSEETRRKFGDTLRGILDLDGIDRVVQSQQTEIDELKVWLKDARQMVYDQKAEIEGLEIKLGDHNKVMEEFRGYCANLSAQFKEMEKSKTELEKVIAKVVEEAEKAKKAAAPAKP